MEREGEGGHQIAYIFLLQEIANGKKEKGKQASYF